MDALELESLLRERVRKLVWLTPLVIVFNCLDWVHDSESALRWLGYRAVIVVLLVCVIHPAIRSLSRDAPYPQMLVYVIGISACLVLIMYESGSFESPYYVALILLGWAFSVIVPMQMTRSLVLGGIILVTYIAAGLLDGAGPSREMVFVSMAMAGALLFTVLGSHLTSGQYLRQRRAEREAYALIGQLEETTRRDPLTGALNRRALDERLEAEFARLDRQGRPFSFALLDLDRFKSTNDRLGRPAGDRVLVRARREMERHLRAEDEFFRIGGDEFAVVLSGAELSEARVAVECLRRALEEARIEENGQRLDITLSAGTAEAMRMDSIASLIERADAALYRAKQNGRNRVECCRQGLEQAADADKSVA